VSDLAVSCDQLIGRVVVVSGIQTQVLLDILRIGTRDDCRLNPLLEPWEVRHIGPWDASSNTIGSRNFQRSSGRSLIVSRV